MTTRSTAVRTAVLGAAVALAAVLSGCGDDGGSDTATSTASTASSTVAESSADSASTDLDAAQAQTILRTVIDPATSAQEKAGLVDSTDPSIGGQLAGFAQGASRGGYTPDKFTVTDIAADGADKATATVEVASPHTPQPVSVPYGLVKVDGTWKLSSQAVTSLLGMAGGPR